MSTTPSHQQNGHRHRRWPDHAFFLILIFIAVVLLLVSIVVNLKK